MWSEFTFSKENEITKDSNSESPENVPSTDENEIIFGAVHVQLF